MHREEVIKKHNAQGKMLKAIVTVYLWGRPFKMDEVSAVENASNIPVIEDTAEALGGIYKGMACGTFGCFDMLLLMETKSSRLQVVLLWSVIYFFCCNNPC